jgi:8-oxo-dGTP diphosphatase
MNKRPEITVKLLMRVNDEVFMLKHHAGGSYDFPGGRMEWGESPEETLARELQEELEYTLTTTPTFFGVWNYVAPDKSRHNVQLQYLLRLDKKPTFTITEHADGLWLNKAFFLDLFQDAPRVDKLFA